MKHNPSVNRLSQAPANCGEFSLLPAATDTLALGDGADAEHGDHAFALDLDLAERLAGEAG
jgi:hypothetical protein